MSGLAETRRVIEVLQRVIAHARAVFGDVALADEAVRVALSRNPRHGDPAAGDAFMIPVLRTISQMARMPGACSRHLPLDAVGGALVGLDARDRECLSLQGIFGFDAERISEVTGEAVDLTEERLRRAVISVGACLVPRGFGLSLNS